MKLQSNLEHPLLKCLKAQFLVQVAGCFDQRAVLIKG